MVSEWNLDGYQCTLCGSGRDGRRRGKGSFCMRCRLPSPRKLPCSFCCSPPTSGPTPHLSLWQVPHLSATLAHSFCHANSALLNLLVMFCNPYMACVHCFSPGVSASQVTLGTLQKPEQLYLAELVFWEPLLHKALSNITSLVLGLQAD